MSSFQHFRLGELAMHQPLPPHLLPPSASVPPPESAPQVQYAAPASGNSFPTNPPVFSSSSGSKQPYGSGDTDDGYTLIFENIDAFNAWREKEEIEQMVEFVKGDTHGSKAVPPRFKDHTKLVCARHSRSGRKKYVKKHPERVRKVPSRKLEGTGCGASISFKTYFDNDEVRACYNAQHSHPIGIENLPFTRRGRKAAVQEEKERPRKYQKTEDDPTQQQTMPQPLPTGATTYLQSHQVPVQQQQQQQQQQPQQQQQIPVQMAQGVAPNQFVSMMGAPPQAQHPLAQPQYQPPPPPQVPYGYPPQGYPMPMPDASPITQDRWQNMSTLFNAIRENSRGFNYPFSSVIALESVLIRLFLESPVPLQANMAANPPPPNASAPDAGPSNNNKGRDSDSDSEDSSG